MTDSIRYIWQIFVLASILVLAGIILIPELGVDLKISHFLITLLSITSINLLTWFVFVRGAKRMGREGAGLMLIGISVKFLLYLLFILLFWLLTKFISKPFIITFFALYLLFTFLLAGNLIKLLKNK